MLLAGHPKVCPVGHCPAGHCPVGHCSAGGPHLKMIHQRHLTDVEVQKEQIILLSFEKLIFEHFLHSQRFRLGSLSISVPRNNSICCLCLRQLIEASLQHFVQK